MTNEQIMKTLRLCADKGCRYCSENGKDHCRETIAAFAWDLLYQQTRTIEKLKEVLKYYLDTNEEKGVIYIPKFVIEKSLKELS